MPNNSYLSTYAKSFNWAGFFLPKKIYLKCSSLYDFCRTVDNIADNDQELDKKKNNFLNLINTGEAVRDFIHIDDVTFIYSLILKQKKKWYCGCW